MKGKSTKTAEVKTQTTPAQEPVKVVTHTEWKRRRHDSGDGYVGAIVLIAIGILFLLNNFGLLPWAIWGTLWRFWPVFIIFWGIETIFGKSWLGKLISGTLALIIVSGVAGFAVLVTNQTIRDAVNSKFPGINIDSLQKLNSKVEEKTFTLSKTDFPNMEKMEATIEIPSGNYSVTDVVEGSLLAVKSKYDTNRYTPTLKGDMSGSDLKAIYTMNSKPGLDFDAALLQNDVTLGNPGVRTDLKLNQSSGTGKITLKSINMGFLQAHLSSGNMDINLAKGAIPVRDSTISISSGNFGLYAPADVGLKVNYTISSGNFKINGIMFSGNGTYYTEGYDSTDTKMVVDVHISSGNVTIVNQ